MTVSGMAFICSVVFSVKDLFIDDESGIWHLSNQEEISNFDFTRLALKLGGLSDTHIFPIPSSRLNYTAKRPQYSVLKSSHGIHLPSLHYALECFMAELPVLEK